jgi:hypothetical protein
MQPPPVIDGFEVREYGYFTRPILPLGYFAPEDGRSPLSPIQNLAVCTAAGLDGYYLFCCTKDWIRVTFSFSETVDGIKKCPQIEFGQDVQSWHKLS